MARAGRRAVLEDINEVNTNERSTSFVGSRAIAVSSSGRLLTGFAALWKFLLAEVDWRETEREILCKEYIRFMDGVGRVSIVS